MPPGRGLLFQSRQMEKNKETRVFLYPWTLPLLLFYIFCCTTDSSQLILFCCFLFVQVLKKFKVLEEKISIHLVEVSPVLSEIQAKLLTGSNSKIIDKVS